MRAAGIQRDMDRLPFCFVDVFSDRPLEGNPLAVVPDADSLERSDNAPHRTRVQPIRNHISAEARGDDADWHLRSFTAAGHEVTGAGHNALGAWWWLAVAGRLPLHDGANAFRQKIASRVLPLQVVFSGGAVRSIVMQHAAPEFGATVSDARALADALGLDAEELLPEGRAAQVVSTGAAHLLIPVRDRSAIDRAKPDAARLLSVLRASGGEGAYLFCRDVARAGSLRTRASSTRRWGSARMRRLGPRRGRSERGW